MGRWTNVLRDFPNWAGGWVRYSNYLWSQARNTFCCRRKQQNFLVKGFAVNLAGLSYNTVMHLL